jgi:hypothetical protein
MELHAKCHGSVSAQSAQASEMTEQPGRQPYRLAGRVAGVARPQIGSSGDYCFMNKTEPIAAVPIGRKWSVTGVGEVAMKEKPVDSSVHVPVRSSELLGPVTVYAAV